MCSQFVLDGVDYKNWKAYRQARDEKAEAEFGVMVDGRLPISRMGLPPVAYYRLLERFEVYFADQIGSISADQFASEPGCGEKSIASINLACAKFGFPGLMESAPAPPKQSVKDRAVELLGLELVQRVESAGFKIVRDYKKRQTP